VNGERVRVHRRRDGEGLFDIADDACIDIERPLAAAIMRD
jgi:hypothetical protein